jgi:hypothetical protein
LKEFWLVYFERKSRCRSIFECEEILFAVTIIANLQTEPSVYVVNQIPKPIRVGDENVVIIGDSGGKNRTNPPHPVFRLGRNISQLHFFFISEGIPSTFGSGKATKSAYSTASIVLFSAGPSLGTIGSSGTMDSSGVESAEVPSDGRVSAQAIEGTSKRSATRADKIESAKTRFLPRKGDPVLVLKILAPEIKPIASTIYHRPTDMIFGIIGI